MKKLKSTASNEEPAKAIVVKSVGRTSNPDENAPPLRSTVTGRSGNFIHCLLDLPKNEIFFC